MQVLMENRANRVLRVNKVSVENQWIVCIPSLHVFIVYATLFCNKVLLVNPAMSASPDNRVRAEKRANPGMLEHQVNVDVMGHPENVVNLDLWVTRAHKDLVALKYV